jgi:uncharacterized damage-inducible protein DinB
VIGHLRRLLLYDVWANRETLRSLAEQSAPPKSLRWLAHILGAERLWIARILGETSSLAVWPDLTVDQCAAHLDDLSGFWPRYMAELEPERLSDEISYVNSKGEPWTSTIADILTHVTMHSTYHRGQIASDMRAAGQVPAYTDYIHAVRTGGIL